MEEIKDIVLKPSMKISELIKEYGKSGAFMSKYLSDACEVFKEMILCDDCFTFLSLTGNLVATGIRGVIAEMIRQGFIDAVITTGGALDHDIARSFGGKYYIGDFDMDDKELHERDIHRLGNVLIPLDSYGPLLEKVIRKNLTAILSGKDSISPRELAKEIGKIISDEHSILRQAYLNNVPVYCPGIVDSAVGTILFFLSQTNKFQLDLFKDMKELLDIVYSYDKTGALIIGGGISKHHVLWWNQFKEGLDYCIYITTAIEYDGSLSGARTKEAISWKKIKPESKQVNLFCEASIVLPLLLMYALEELQ